MELRIPGVQPFTARRGSRAELWKYVVRYRGDFWNRDSPVFAERDSRFRTAERDTGSPATTVELGAVRLGIYRRYRSYMRRRPIHIKWKHDTRLESAKRDLRRR